MRRHGQNRGGSLFPVLAVYFIISLDEFVKIPAVYLNDKKYRWVKDLTVS